MKLSQETLRPLLGKVLECPSERVLSWVVDRAILGKEVFEKVQANPALHLITWEKGYQAQSWPPAGGVSGSMLLWLQTKGEPEAAKRQKRIEELEPAPASDQEDREWARLRQVQTRWQGTRQERQKQIDSLSQELAQLDEKAETAQKTESRLERLIEEKRVRMEPNNKRLMDNLRVIARNAFYAALAPFKKAYNSSMRSSRCCLTEAVGG